LTPRSDTVVYQRFGGSLCLHLQEESTILRNVGILLHHYTASQPTSQRYETLCLSFRIAVPVPCWFGRSIGRYEETAFWTHSEDNIITWNANIKMFRKAVGEDDADWIRLRVAISGGVFLHCNEPSGCTDDC
jgi:hypothetical protein